MLPVALVRDRLGEQAVETSLVGRTPRVAEASAAQRLDESDGAHHVRPQRAQPCDVALVAVERHDRVDQLAGAVVFGNRVGAARIDAARHATVRLLVRREPRDERARRVVDAHGQQRVVHQRAVADPGAFVGARAGLQRVAGARDEHLRDGAAQRRSKISRLGRQPQFRARQPFPPDLDRVGEHPLGVRGRVARGRQRRDELLRRMERNGDHHFATRARRELERVAERARLEEACVEEVRFRERRDRRSPVHTQDATVVTDLADGARSASFVQILPRRIHLERAQSQ